MRTCYGIDDMGWLIVHNERPGTITVRAHEATFHLPVPRSDNRREVELFHRDDLTTRSPGQVDKLHETLKEAFAGLVPSTHARAARGFERPSDRA